MSSLRSSDDAAIRAAMIASAALMAQQVAGKSVRDALFFSNYPVTSLPAMLAAAAFVSVAAAVAASQALAGHGPARFVRATLVASAAALLGEGALAVWRPAWAAVALFLHIAAAGPILISGFWAVMNERLDPRSGKRAVGRIGAFGALGGLLGGLLAERAGAWLSLPALFPALAAMHAAAAWALRGTEVPGERTGDPATRAGVRSAEAGAGSAARAGAAAPEEVPSLASGVRAVAEAPYLRSLGLLVVLSAAGAALLDYVFKAEVRAVTPRGEELVRIFSAFYTATAVLAFALHAGVTRAALERFGLARTAAALPGTILLGAIPFLAEPGLARIIIARGAEIGVRGSLFRGGYELLYTPVPPAQKRTAKILIDVGGERLGDAIGAGIAALYLALAPDSVLPRLVATAALLGGAALLLTRSIQRGYVRSLERNLVLGTIAVDEGGLSDVTTRTAILRLHRPAGAAERGAGAAERGGATAASGPASLETTAAFPAVAAPGGADPVAAHVAILRSGSPDAVRSLLAARRPLPRTLAPHLVPLLADGDLAKDAAAALLGTSGPIVGLLTDALLDRDSDLALRQRIPRILAAEGSDRAVDGLLLGLEDTRFEVRFQCGRALARLREGRPGLVFDRGRIFAVVLRDVEVDRSVWEGQRLLARLVDPGESPLVDDYLRDRAHRSLEHVFTVLSLVLPSAPLRIAFRALHTEDPTLRGTALEYLESVLPPPVRDRLWPFLEERGGVKPVERSRDEILDQLVQANRSVEINLAELRKRLNP